MVSRANHVDIPIPDSYLEKENVDAILRPVIKLLIKFNIKNFSNWKLMVLVVSSPTGLNLG